MLLRSATARKMRSTLVSNEESTIAPDNSSRMPYVVRLREATHLVDSRISNTNDVQWRPDSALATISHGTGLPAQVAEGAWPASNCSSSRRRLARSREPLPEELQRSRENFVQRNNQAALGGEPSCPPSSGAARPPRCRGPWRTPPVPG
jgi:hypothetical protein